MSSIVIASAVKVTAVIVFGLAASILLRHRSAALRHWMLAGAILCAVALPFVERVVPVWRIDVGTPLPPSTPAARQHTSTAVPSVVELVEVAAPAPPATIASSARESLKDWLVPAWIVGSILALLFLAIGLGRLAWLASRARPLTSGVWPVQMARIAASYGLARPVTLLQSEHPSLLVTWGVLRPKILIPRPALSWSADRVAIVLRHELAHIRRADWPVQIAGEVLRAFHWFNPLVWIACRQLREESERACDDAVLTCGVDAPEYAAQLLELARALRAEHAPSLPAPAIARSSSLERRVRAMLNTGLTRTPTSRSVRAAGAAALTVFTVAIAAAQTKPVKLSGSVSDSMGAPVSGVTIALTQAQTGARYQVRTDQNGNYEFVPLPADEYRIEAVQPAFKKVEDTVKLSGAAVRRDIRLELGTLEETISVRAARSQDGNNGNRARVVGSSDRSAFQRMQQSCQAGSAGGQVRPPHKIKDVRPIYPAALAAANVSGKVVMQATIGTDGNVSDVQVLESAHPDLDNAALEAVRQWEFDGTLLNCVAVPVSIKVSISFSVE